MVIYFTIWRNYAVEPYLKLATGITMYSVVKNYVELKFGPG